MNIQQLRKDHPNLYAQCLAEGAQKERQRILSALPGPGRSAWERYTYECIKDGTPMTDTAKVRHSLFAIETVRKQADSEAVVVAVERTMGVWQ